MSYAERHCPEYINTTYALVAANEHALIVRARYALMASSHTIHQATLRHAVNAMPYPKRAPTMALRVATIPSPAFGLIYNRIISVTGIGI